MKKVKILKAAMNRYETRIQELFLELSITQSALRATKLIYKVYEEDQRLDSLVYFCVNGEYPDE